MAYKVTRSKAKRRAEQKAKGVEDGDIKKGAKGRTARRWNEKTARWEKMKVVEKRGIRLEGSKKLGTGKKNTPPDYPSRSSSRADKNVGLGGNAAPYKRPGRRPAQEKVVNVKPKKRADNPSASEKGRRDPWGSRTEVVTPKSGKSIPIGFVVLRGTPRKKYIWNGERFERYYGPRQPSPEKS